MRVHVGSKSLKLLIEFLIAEKHAVSQTEQHPTLCNLNAYLDLPFVLGFPNSGGKHRCVVVSKAIPICRV